MPIPTVYELQETANIPDVITDENKFYQYGEMNKLLKYYYLKYTDIDLVTYMIDDTEIISTLTPLEQEITQYTNTEEYFSNYSLKLLKDFNFDLNNIWNGAIADIRFKDSELLYRKSDYYTMRLVTELLFLELTEYIENTNKEISEVQETDLPLRNEYLNTIHDFKEPNFVTDCSVGGVIFGKMNNTWHVLLIRRSEEVDTSKGMVSIMPNGRVEYNDFQQSYDESGFDISLEREFTEELNSKDYISFNSDVSCVELVKGWDVLTGGFTKGSALFIDDSGKFEQLVESQSSNFEVNELITIDIIDKTKLLHYLTSNNTHQGNISIILRGLEQFNKIETLPELPYTIQEK